MATPIPNDTQRSVQANSSALWTLAVIICLALIVYAAYLAYHHTGETTSSELGVYKSDTQRVPTD